MVSPSPDIVSMNGNGIPNAGGSMEDTLTENRGNMVDVLVENQNSQHFYPNTAQFLQRRHSMPLYGQTVHPSQAQPPPYYSVHSAPTTVAEMSTEIFPIMKNIEGTGQYIVVDNQFFHFQGMHQSHAVDAADFLTRRGVQNPFHEHSNATNAYGTRDANTHFSGGQMLASVSGGI